VRFVKKPGLGGLTLFGLLAVRVLGAGAASTEELRARIDALVTAEKYAGAIWSVEIASLDTGRTLYAHHPGRRMSPASNSKLYTGALALDTLGGAHRIRTPLLSSAPVGADGTLAGDLVVAGRGDPGWNPRQAKKDFWTAFEPFVAELRRAGVKRIKGDIVADSTWLRSTPQGASWTADDMNEDYGAEISALTLDENYVDLRITPGAQPGDAVKLDVLQPLSGLEFRNELTTVAPEAHKKSGQTRVLRLPGENLVRLQGTVPAGGKMIEAEATVPRPAQWFAVALREALLKAGLAVDGGARSLRWPESPALATVQVGEVVSAPLRDLVRDFMVPSQNLKTDLIFAHLGEMRRPVGAPEWIRSDELAVDQLEAFLKKIGARPGDVRFDEGSGLSRNNLTTAAATVALLKHMASHREAEAFRASLPVAGVEGTLRKRLKGTAAEGKVRAKTGGLRWAATLSGYVTSAAGERLVFSLMLNRQPGTEETPASRGLDEIVVMLAEFAGKP
jgi:D-alanyl-D-alanine carboxypeptidase/D-alanyl-D-alanine-endopeptidase (penicillin-binding protein 4)